MPHVRKQPGSSREEQSEPNFRLYQNWKRVLRQIPGFEQCTCLRRVRTPNKKDPDFFLLSATAEPRIGLVECEGRKGAGERDRPIAPRGVEQLLTYVAGIESVRGAGEAILNDLIKDAFLPRKRKKPYQRGEDNVAHWGSYERWLSSIGSAVQSEIDLIRVLSAGSRDVVPILLYYRRTGTLPEEERMLSNAFRRHRLFFGAVKWPEADGLITGKYL